MSQTLNDTDLGKDHSSQTYVEQPPVLPIWFEVSEFIETRVSLACLELKNSFNFARIGVLSGGLALVFIFIALVALGLALCIQVWDSPNRLTILYSVAGVFALIGIGLFCFVQKCLQRMQSPLPATSNEIRKDWKNLKGVCGHE